MPPSKAFSRWWAAKREMVQSLLCPVDQGESIPKPNQWAEQTKIQAKMDPGWESLHWTGFLLATQNLGIIQRPKLKPWQGPYMYGYGGETGLCKRQVEGCATCRTWERWHPISRTLTTVTAGPPLISKRDCKPTRARPFKFLWENVLVLICNF